jgi:putative transposase
MTANPFASGSKVAKMAAVYNGFLRRDALAPLAMVYETLSREPGVSVSSVKRYVRHIKTNGYQPKQHEPRPLAAWDEEALNFFKMFYLAVRREVGRCTVRNAYRQTAIVAAQKGWKIGSEQSAYVHAREIHSALKLYVRGGGRALDNLFYIARDLSTLRPFQIVVGDQHRFDFWVRDDQGSYFRPECYLWLDMRTRLVYGIAFDRNYNTRTVLRALKMGVERFGKFENTYNDNGSGEKSSVADYTIEQLQQYGMKFCDEGDMYRTDNGAFVVEDAEGKMISVAKSRSEWKKQNRRIFANVKNAKTKPIERFFSTLEQILVDMCLPGYVAEIKTTAAEEEESARRLEWQKKNNYILTLEEFAHKVVSAIEHYEHRTHGTLKHSPQEDLKIAIHEEGWRPAYIEQQDLFYLFLERSFATVRDGRVTLAGRQYIGPDLTQDMLKTNRGNLAGLNRQKVELRYDPDDPEYGIWAIDPRDNQAIFLTPIKAISMLDNDAASAALEWKRKNMRAVRETYQSITAEAPRLFEPEKFRELNESREAAIASANETSKAVVPQSPAMTENDFRSLVAEKITVEPQIRDRAKPVYLSPRDRYEALLFCIAKKEKVSAADLAFMAEFEKDMTDEQTAYFSSLVSMNNKQ